MREAREIIAEWSASRADRMQGIYDHVKADAIIAALDAAGLAIVPKDFIAAVRDLRCPSDRIDSIGVCFDANVCGCTIGLHLTAAGAKT